MGKRSLRAALGGRTSALTPWQFRAAFRIPQFHSPKHHLGEPARAYLNNNSELKTMPPYSKMLYAMADNELPNGPASSVQLDIAFSDVQPRNV
jgi:hypothetical protein